MPRTVPELREEQAYHERRAHKLRGKSVAARQEAQHFSRAAKRNREEAHELADKIAARTGPVGADAAVAWALRQVGGVEQPAASNKGPKITEWEIASGYAWVQNAAAGVPWCQCFVNAAAVIGGAPQLRTGYTPTVLAGIGGYKPVSAANARAGDFVFFKWPGVSHDTCDHVGLLVRAPSATGSVVDDVEGNTSPDDGGSQNNGGGVYHRTNRSKTLVVGYVRPPYREA